MTHRSTQTRPLRIIAGKWKGRKITAPAIDGCRPTADRVRETLFNWLQPYIQGASCLDAFAGSGILGLEALSRGAAEVVALERAKSSAAAISASAKVLQASALQVMVTDSLNWLATTDRGFDIIFLDPPFNGDGLMQALRLIQPGRQLTSAGLIYVEAPSLMAATLGDWQLIRQATAGAVSYGLLAAK